jgi:uncharacterized membrane protein YkoI
MRNALTWLACLALLAPLGAEAATTRDEAAQIAQRMTGGRVLAVERIERDGHTVWRVKVVTPQGEVKVVVIDADSGRAL